MTVGIFLALSTNLHSMENKEVTTPYDRVPFSNTQPVQKTTPFPVLVWRSVMKKLDLTSLSCISKVNKSLNNIAKDAHLKIEYTNQQKKNSEAIDLFNQVINNQTNIIFIDNYFSRITSLANLYLTKKFMNQLQSKKDEIYTMLLVGYTPHKSIVDDFVNEAKSYISDFKNKESPKTIDLFFNKLGIIAYATQYDDIAKDILTYMSDYAQDPYFLLKNVIKQTDIKSRKAMAENALNAYNEKKKKKGCVIF